MHVLYLNKINELYILNRENYAFYFQSYQAIDFYPIWFANCISITSEEEMLLNLSKRNGLVNFLPLHRKRGTGIGGPGYFNLFIKIMNIRINMVSINQIEGDFKFCIVVMVRAKRI